MRVMLLSRWAATTTTFTYVAPTAGLAASGGGTAASGATLSVSGSPNQAPLLSITNTANGMASLTLAPGGDIPWSIGANSPPNNPTFRGLFFNSGRIFTNITKMVITPGGMVGIGTTIPSKLLDVFGDGNFNGSLSAGSGSFTGILSAGSFTGSGAGLTSLNASSLSSGAVADVRLSSNVPLLSNASNTFTGSLSAGSLSTTGPLTVGANLTTSGNVGIGTASPARRLDVVGDASVSGTLSAGTLFGAGLSGMNEFTNDQNIPSATYTWTAPAGVTHVMVDMWSGGMGGESPITGGGGGRGGTYSRSVVGVVPGTAYTIVVGGGGLGTVFNSGEPGHTSSMSLGGVTLINAVGLYHLVSNPSIATISRGGYDCFPCPPSGLAAFGATFCLGPLGDKTGRGGDANVTGNAGYVLLTW